MIGRNSKQFPGKNGASRLIGIASPGHLRVIAFIVLGALLLIGTRVQAEMNPRYYDGDWVNYTTVRFVNSVALTHDIAYFGTEGGVARYDRVLQRWLPAMTTAEGLPSNQIRRLAYDFGTEELFAETPEGVSVYHDVIREWRYTSFFPDSIAQPWRRVDLTEYDLPFGYDALQAGYLTGPNLRSYRVRGAIEDSYGALWVGTWGQFVWVRPNGRYDVEPQRWGLYHDNVEAIFLDGETIYFGGTNYYGEGGLSVYDTTNALWDYFESRFTRDFSSDHIRRIAGEPGGRYLWMATDDGLVRYDRKRGEFRTIQERHGLSDDRVFGLCLDGDILWVGTEDGIDGLYLPTDSIFSATTLAVNDARVYTVLVTGEVVWLGTDRGLFRLAKPVPDWKLFSTGTDPMAGIVRSLVYDDGKLYVGSDRGIGIIDLEGDEPIQIYEAPSALRDEDIYDLAVTDQIVWAATRSGLIRFVPGSREQRVFTAGDGMVDQDVQRITVDGDYLWLGTPSGVSRFRWNSPQRID